MERVIMEAIAKYNLFDTDELLVIAVSGGADSMMLLHVLAHRGYNLLIAHVNHQVRPESALDQKLVEETGAKLGIPVHVHLLPPVPRNENFHAYARRGRYDFFARLAKAHGSRCMVTAHHGDDHMETVVQRFLHHQSASGLIGIRPLTQYAGIHVTRPLIGLKKSEIYEYCNEAGIPYQEDASNANDAYTRGRIRHQILPSLLQESPMLFSHIRSLSDGVSEDEAYFSGVVDGLLEKTEAIEGGCQMSRKWLCGLPPALSKRLIKRVLAGLGIQDFTSNHLSEILRLARLGNPNVGYALPKGAYVLFAYDQAEILTKLPKALAYDLELALNGEAVLPNGASLVINYKKDIEIRAKSCINEVHLCYNEIELPLRVRTRKNGDRIHLMGGGTKKIKEIMIEAKIPKNLRGEWPIITDASDRILWLPLLKKTAACRDIATGDMITLVYRHLGGSLINAQ
ncbi:MAG: tRNA lysidine(34) synthetase TilS [Turicibacter sp.]|nr:tRNA lysidine(34) synthetase TilS [Turicibacter sp.]